MEHAKVAQHAMERKMSSDDTTPQKAVDFSSFVISLAAAAMVHLGKHPDPVTGELTPNRALARSNIDIMIMLEEKTKGNLDEHEEKLVSTVLHDLRNQYLK